MPGSREMILSITKATLICGEQQKETAAWENEEGRLNCKPTWEE